MPKTPMDRLFDSAVFQCGCCGKPAPGGDPTCSCWEVDIDRCDRSDGYGCVVHCACPRCVANRADGYERVNWTGTQHYAHAKSPTTLCGRAIGGPQLWRAPVVRAGRLGECIRCAAKLTVAITP